MFRPLFCAMIKSQVRIEEVIQCKPQNELCRSKIQRDLVVVFIF